MIKNETQIDIINRLLPGSILTEEEKNIIQEIEKQKEEYRIFLAAYPLSEEAKDKLLKEAHPYIRNLLKKLEQKGRFVFESFADWYDLKAVSYETVAQYIQGKAAHQILEYNLVRTGEMTEEKLKACATKKSKKLKILIKSGTPLDTRLPLVEKLNLYQSLNIISKMASQEMIYEYDYDNNQTLAAMEIYGGAMFYAEWYYKHQDSEIDSYIENVIKKEIEHKAEIQDTIKERVFIKNNIN